MTNMKSKLEELNIQWTANNEFPKWVNLDSVDLDQFYTQENIATYCFDKTIEFLQQQNIDITKVFFVEPSAGTGSFLKLLPKQQCIGLDLEPKTENIIEADYLSFDMNNILSKNKHSTFVAIGNPPFGVRGWLALSFLNKTATWADYAAFILPMSFMSEGKGSPKYRVSGMKVVYEEELPKNAFIMSDGTEPKLSTIFQIWAKGDNVKPDWSELEKRFEVRVVQNTKGRTCGQELKNTADIFIPQAFYENSKSYAQTTYNDDYMMGTAYAITALNKKDKDAMIKGLLNADWYNNYSSPATHGCRHVNKHYIMKCLNDIFE